ncbi:hypothetical protein E2C01_082851 [Portunus trituberculatus]|uniref:Uncharacterized protein n=1 Tax=Portunus trituberculatus TaxID=210409 RepID=A0A5B7IZJ5_PORTR|nr:hypothetical protein [Portunus trituberculatus]
MQKIYPFTVLSRLMSEDCEKEHLSGCLSHTVQPTLPHRSTTGNMENFTERTSPITDAKCNL